MFRFITSIAGTSPEPFPSSTMLDPATVNPGPIGGVVFFVFTIAVVFFIFSFYRPLKKIKFEQDTDEQ